MATKKKIKKLMQSMIQAMPVIMEQTHEVHHVKGSVLLEQGHHDVNPDKTYTQNMPVLVAFNHEKRLKAAYNRSGRQGVTEYIKSLQKIVAHEANNS